MWSEIVQLNVIEDDLTCDISNTVITVTIKDANLKQPYKTF